MTTRRCLTALGLWLLAGGGLAGTAVAAEVAPVPEVTAALGLAPAVDVDGEVTRLRGEMAREVKNRVARSPASDAVWIGLARAAVGVAGMTVERPQLLVVVDRNPRVQQLAVVAAVPRGDWAVVGVTRVSTGSMGRFDHYVTPLGVFRVTDEILGFRAQGTVNENGIRGLGAKGMRVWDFGWQVAAKGWDAGPGKPDKTPIRLMMHATDPDRLEQRLGQPASQGCVRIPSSMNVFLDMHGVLDAEYERAAVTEIRFRALLPAGREPSALAGNTLVVVDSAEAARVPHPAVAGTARAAAPVVRTPQG